MVALLLAVTAACATAGSSGSYDRNRISYEDIQAAGQTNAYDVIRVHRPQWLRPRGWNEGDIAVYMDGSRMGDTDVLRSILTEDVHELRFLTASEAQTRFGSGHGSGAILVSSRRAEF